MGAYFPQPTPKKAYLTDCGVALDLLCPLDCDFPLGIHPSRHGFISRMLYDMIDEFQMGNHSLTDIINLKQFHNLLSPVLLGPQHWFTYQNLQHFARDLNFRVKVIARPIGAYFPWEP